VSEQRPAPTDEELEARLREAFGRAAPPSAPESLRTQAADLAQRTDGRGPRSWFGSLPFAFAAVAILVAASLVASVLTTSRHSTTQGEDDTSPAATASPTRTATPSAAPSASAPTAALPALVTGRYRSRTALQGWWCLDFQIQRERYDAEESIEVSTWPPAAGRECGPPPEPDEQFVDYRGWNRGTIGPLDDGTPAIFVRLVVDLQSPFQELDMALEQTDCCLVGTAASFGGEVVELERVGPADPLMPQELYDGRSEIMPPLDVPPAPDADLPLAGWDVEAQVGCNGERFLFSGLWAEPGAELRTGPKHDALREAIEWTGDPAMQGTWWEAGHSEDQAIFLTGPAHDPWYIKVGVRDGRWQYTGLGDCGRFAWAPPGYGIGNWALDPAFREPTASSTRLHLLVTEERCSSGQTALGRISPAFVFPAADEIRIQLFVQALPRGQDCRNPAPPANVVVDLPEALGNRTLRDGNITCRFCGG
jgi:hypothetical protein